MCLTPTEIYRPRGAVPSACSLRTGPLLVRAAVLSSSLPCGARKFVWTVDSLCRTLGMPSGQDDGALRVAIDPPSSSHGIFQAAVAIGVREYSRRSPPSL